MEKIQTGKRSGQGGQRTLARITIQGLKKQFGNLKILKGIDLDIADGEFLTLVGPSGCGKSTTLRIIAGLENQSAGDVRIDDRLVNDIRASSRDLAMVFQSYALYPHLTVGQNLLTPLVLRDFDFWERLPLFGALVPGRRAKKDALLKIVHETAETLKIEHLLDRRPGQLSGGQRQRVALGRAMVRQPAAFLMDEPLSNLDAGLRIHMRAELAELHRSIGTTFIYVTHDQAEALTMSDRMAVMMDGEILQLGPPGEIYENPRDLRVAEFIGSPQINILPGQCDASGRITCLDIALSRGLGAADSGSVSIGLRPEHMILRAESNPDCFPGRLVHIENLGSDIFLHVVLESGGHRIVVRANPYEAQHAAIGDAVWIGREPDKALVFDGNGHRLPLASAQQAVRSA